MFIRAFKTNYIYLPILMIVVTFLLWLNGFLFYSEISIPTENQAPLYSFIAPFLERYKFINVLLAFVLLILQAFMLNNVITLKNFIDRYSYMPGFLYAVLMSSSFEMLSLHPVLISNFFLIIVLNKIVDVYHDDRVYLEIFNVGFLIGIASLFYFPSILFVLLAIIALFIYFLVSLRSIIATGLGVFTPFFFLGMYYFMVDKLEKKFNEFIGLYEPFKIFSIELGTYFEYYIIFLSFLAFVALIKVYFVVVLDNPIRIRKRYNVLLFYLIVSLTSLLFITQKNMVYHGVLMVPLSAILACFFHSNKKNFWNELFFTILIISLVLMKIQRFI